MYLKSLELHGFKSFPNRTVLTFEPGATVIVGPNGSGKSNISDAMRWVLGELSSRNIRGTKMVDVIFGGTDDRRPMGFAEVSVTFDNTDPVNRLDTDFDEVTITRRYYRTGESEYLINREQKRLKDIHMLFMNTGVGREGYSIIGQGKVAEIVSKKSDERRNIFEEAAGISKYRYKKEEAERKLKTVSENLDRINDIRLLLESRVGPLEKEAEKAKKGLAIYEEKKRLDVSLWLYDTKQIIDEIDEARRQYELSKHELEVATQIIEELDAQILTLGEKTASGRSRSNQLRDEIAATIEKLHALDNSLRVAESNFSHSAELIEACNARIAEIERSEYSIGLNKAQFEGKKKTFTDKLDELNDQKLDLLNEQQAMTVQIDAINRQLEDALDEITVENNLLTDLKIRTDVLENAMVTDGSKSQDIEKEIEKYEEEGALLKDEADKCEANASVFKVQIAEKDAVISSSQTRLDTLEADKEKEHDMLMDLQLQNDAAKQRADVLDRMNEHFDGFLESVKFVMREYKAGNIPNASEVYGPVSSLIKVDQAYITAIDTALGASLQNIVVDDVPTAKACMAALKKANAGRVTLYPLTSVRQPNESDEIRIAKSMPGFIGRADQLVEIDGKYRIVIEHLLLRTLVFDNIDNASVAAKKSGYRVKMVTLDGQVINSGGSFTGGSAKRDSGILSRTSEIAKLKEKSERLAKEIEEKSQNISKIEAEIEDVRSALKTAEQEKELLLTLSRSQFAALDNANARYDANQNIIDKFKMDLAALTAGKEKAEEELIQLRADHHAAEERLESLKQYRSDKAVDVGVLDEKRDEVIGKVNNINISIAEVRKDIEGVDTLIETVLQRLRDLDADKKAQEERILSLEDKRNNIDALKNEHKSEYQALEAELARLNRERGEVDEGTFEYEKELENIRQRQREKTSSQQVLTEYKVRNQAKLDQLEEKQIKLASQLTEEYSLTYADAVALNYPPITAENRDESVAQQTSCRSRLRALGGYNPNAVAEYAEVKSQYDELNVQYLDLTQSRDETIDIISRIEEEMRTSFVQAFNDINKNFSITFKELFGGGSAELSLTEPEDVLTSGIEIKAAPPGKIIKSMSLLSGGEQSFVAIALLFAILKVNPTPFCILDEIEAALDEVNVFRFGEYVKKLCNDTQFILITHRRGTMEIGDRLYGVTMPQRGISQAIELNVNEIEGKQKELLDGVL